MKRSLILVLALLALCMSAPIASGAAVPGPGSDASLRWARTRVERDLDMLQRDNHDYDGHRVKAISDMQAARYQILLGLGYDANHENLYNASPYASNNVNGCNGSDANLIYTRRDVENVIDVLQRDNTDYGGHRVDAIGELQQARQQIVDALIWDATH